MPDVGNILVWTVWIIAATALFSSGIAVILFQNPFYSALALILNLASLAVLNLLLEAEFVAAAQGLVYAGAGGVLFLFVIAYLGGRGEGALEGGPSLLVVGAIVAAGAIGVEVVVAIVL
jgi:NADH-quinone oxidoreductase subunit J